MKRNGLSSFLISLVLGFAPACGGAVGGLDDAGPGGNGGQGGDGDGEPAGTTWTFFVYGAADNNLSNSLIRDMAEMVQAKLTDDIHVVVLADFDSSQTMSGSSDGFPKGALWYRIRGSGADPELLEQDAEENLDDPQVLADSITSAFTSFPADHYAVVLWDHGGSWQGGFGGDTQNGTVTQPSPMAAATVAQAVKDGLAGANIAAPLDLFAFDTCLMGGLEVASEFQELTRVYLAEAEIDYGDGWDYDGFLTHLASHSTDTPSALAVAEVGIWDKHHTGKDSDDTLLRSHVALDMPSFGKFLDSYRSFTKLLSSSDAAAGAELGRSSYFALPTYMNQLENPGDIPELRDVGQFLRRLEKEAAGNALATAAKASSTALDTAILARAQGKIRSAAGQSGVHLELPLANALNSDLVSAYEQLAPAFVQDTGWDGALKFYEKLSDGQAPAITTTLENADAPDAQHLPTIDFSVSDPDLAEAQVDVGLLNPDNADEVIFHGVTAKGAIDADTSYSIPWNGQITALPDGKGGVQSVFVRVWEDLGQDVATGEAIAPLLASFGNISSPDQQDMFGALLFQDGDQEATLLALFDPAITLKLSEVASDLPGSTFTPVLPTIAISSQAQSTVSGAPIALDSASVPVTQVAASAGTYALITTATDVFGNSNSDVQVVTLAKPISP